MTLVRRLFVIGLSLAASVLAVAAVERAYAQTPGPGYKCMSHTPPCKLPVECDPGVSGEGQDYFCDFEHGSGTCAQFQPSSTCNENFITYPDCGIVTDCYTGTPPNPPVTGWNCSQGFKSCIGHL